MVGFGSGGILLELYPLDKLQEGVKKGEWLKGQLCVG
jgi:hypothetical protein